METALKRMLLGIAVILIGCSLNCDPSLMTPALLLVLVGFKITLIGYFTQQKN